MKKHTFIILSLSTVILSGCATTKQVHALIDENNTRYDSEIAQLRTEQQQTKLQLTESRKRCDVMAENIRNITINTQSLQEARQNLLHYCREHSAVLGRFIDSMEDKSSIKPNSENPRASSSTNIIPMTTPEPVY